MKIIQTMILFLLLALAYALIRLVELYVEASYWSP
jgi:hypothetical protein